MRTYETVRVGMKVSLWRRCVAQSLFNFTPEIYLPSFFYFFFFSLFPPPPPTSFVFVFSAENSCSTLRVPFFLVTLSVSFLCMSLLFFTESFRPYRPIYVASPYSRKRRSVVVLTRPPRLARARACYLSSSRHATTKNRSAVL